MALLSGLSRRISKLEQEVEELKKLIRTTEDATQIGPQRQPSSVNKIKAETKQVQRELDLVDEQQNDDQVVAGKNSKYLNSKWDE